MDVVEETPNCFLIMIDNSSVHGCQYTNFNKVTFGAFFQDICEDVAVSFLSVR